MPNFQDTTQKSRNGDNLGMAFPGAIPTFTGFTSSHTLAQDIHAAQHNLEQSEIVALATKMGTGASTPTLGMVFRGTGTGTSAWQQVTLTTDVTGVLAVANGGTGASTLTGLTIPSAQLTASPTLTTPIIASFTTSQHNHQNAAGGGVLTAPALPALRFDQQTLSNPYKFRVYRTGVLTTNATTSTPLPFDAATFDTNSNVDIVTNKGRYTAPVAGYYFFSGRFRVNSTDNVALLFRNGIEYSRGTDIPGGAAQYSAAHNDVILLAANDYVEFVYFCSAAQAMDVGQNAAWFTGYLISTT